MIRNSIDLSGLLEGVSKDLLPAIMVKVGQRLWEYTARNFPLKRKLTGKDLYIDAKSVVGALILGGRAPNAAEIKGFSAPVARRMPARPHPVKIDGRWHVVSTKTKLGRLGVYERPTVYRRGSTIDLGYFGLRRGGKIRAYGVSEDWDALPAYSIDAVTWLAEQKDAIALIVSEAVQEVSI